MLNAMKVDIDYTQYFVHLDRLDNDFCRLSSKNDAIIDRLNCVAASGSFTELDWVQTLNIKF